MQTLIISTEHVSELEKRQLYALFEQFYNNTSYKTFCADFAEKQWLIRMDDGTRTVGFSTQQLIRLTISGQEVRVLFSGDTVVHPDYWNKSHLAGAFGHLFLNIESESDSPLFWFLITKGFRTYRFLPVFFRAFYPTHSGACQELKPLLDAIALSKFDSQYDPETECIEFADGKDFLCDQLVSIPMSRLHNPHVAFFLRRNPGYCTGTELACIAPLGSENLTKSGQRVIQATEIKWHV